jgi:NADH dehydrogenase [ubiquinone] 1 alpha subcomplex assembly factor 1
MSGADDPDRTPKTLFTFNTQEAIRECALGSDADVGGYSTVHLDLEHSSHSGQKATAKFWGEMSLDVKPHLKGRVRAGYAGFRNHASVFSVHPGWTGDSLLFSIGQHSSES